MSAFYFLKWNNKFVKAYLGTWWKSLLTVPNASVDRCFENGAFSILRNIFLSVSYCVVYRWCRRIVKQFRDNEINSGKTSNIHITTYIQSFAVTTVGFCDGIVNQIYSGKKYRSYSVIKVKICNMGKVEV